MSMLSLSGVIGRRTWKSPSPCNKVNVSELVFSDSSSSLERQPSVDVPPTATFGKKAILQARISFGYTIGGLFLNESGRRILQ